MGEIIDDVFNNAEPEVIDEGVVEQQEPQQVENAPQDGTAGDAGETTAPAHGQVPLAALEAERKGRQDWKEQAIRAQEAERQLREQLAQLQQPQTQPDPVQLAESRMHNMLLNASELTARQQWGNEKVDAAYAKFRQASDRNPALHQQALQSTNPWDFVVREGLKMQMLEEVGTDPQAYEAKIREKVLADIQRTNQSVNPAVNLPQSLAGVRSVGPRSGLAYTGPQPLDKLFG